MIVKYNYETVYSQAPHGILPDEHFRFLVYFRERNIIDARWTCKKFFKPLSMPDG